MLEIAKRAAPPEVWIEAQTMEYGPSFIANETALAEAAKLVVQAGIAADREGVDGILVAGFGDPGLTELRKAVNIPVTGIAEAGMAKAAEGGRKFSIITTTPDLKQSIERTAFRYGYTNRLVAVHITIGDTNTVMGNKNMMSKALLQIAHQSAQNDGVDAILIGGGPLASSADQIASESSLPIIEPVLEGILLSISRVLGSKNTKPEGSEF
ncbi:aspartate/glutamate racemase family protein [Falsihalocynthiibacter arcticus]|nr:aspartate/glutamate racemase family protein [Falsihalocynthiibacter arcticus]